MSLIPKQSDILYIIYKYLKSLDGFQSTTETLHDELISSSVLGKTIGWNGEERLYQLSDYQQIYPNVTENQIVQHLQKSLSTIPNMKTINIRSSLLHQLLGIYNPLDTIQVKRFHELASKYIEIIEKFHVNEKIIKYAIIRKEYLQSCLSKNSLLISDHDTTQNIQLDSTKTENNVLITSTSTIIESNHIKGSNKLFSIESMLPVLQEVGQSKEITHLKSQIHNVNINSQLLQVEINAITSDLAELGCLSTGINRGNIDCANDLLLSREIGIANVHLYSGSSALSRAFVTSASSVGAKMLNRFRVLWTISGHMLNPAYCAVFDQSGRFILSGADDYLVKIWDVNSGQLVKTCKGHLGYISLIAISPDNSLFASACTMGTIRIWRLRDGLCLQVLNHKASVNWIKFDRTSCALASASDDGQCIVWDLCKLLPADGTDIPFFDVLIEEKESLNNKNLVSKFSKSKSEMNIIMDTEEFNVVNDLDLQMKSSGGLLQISSNVTYTPYAGEARLISAVQNRLDADNQISQYTERKNVDIFSTNASNFREVHQEIIQSTSHAPVHLINSRGGLFYWSGGSGRGEFGVGLGEEDFSKINDTRLMLPHIQDQFKAFGEEEPLKVNCLDISPLGNILVTGCEDGVARVWRFGDVDSYSTRMPKASQALKLLKEMGASPSELSRMQRVARLLLMRLEGHVSPITDIHMNQFGDRVLTGSAQDCNVRIWSLSKDYKNSLHIVLDLSEEEDTTTERQSSANAGGRGRRTRMKSQLYNTCWTTDGSKVITVQSVVSSSMSNSASNSDRMPTRLKVWDAMNGDLLKIIWNISSINCRVLIKHPYNSSIVATTGEDGYVNLWNLDQEENLCKLRIYNDDKTPAFLVDASFSEDGTRIALTDNLGRLSLLGLDDPERYSKVYKEQYFSTDYANIMLDAVGFAIDVGTQMLIHEAPIGLLTSLNGTPYDNQPCFKQGPMPLPKENIKLMLKNIQKDRQYAPKEMDRVYTTFNKNISHHRTHRKYSGAKPNTSKNVTSPTFEYNQNRVRYREFDINNYESSSEDSDISEFEIDRSARLVRSTNNNSNSNNRSNNRSNIRTLRDIPTQQRRSSRSRSYINSYNESDTENIQESATLSRAARAAQRAAKRGEVEIYDYDNTESDEDDDETENTSQSPQLVDTSDDERAAISKALIAKQRIKDDKKAISKAKLSNSSWYNVKNGVLSSNLEVSRDWLQSDTRTDQYCPQLGDRVIYLPQGHILWLQDFQETISPPWNKFAGKFPLVECEVRNIQYVFPLSYKEYIASPSVKAIVELVVVKIPSQHTITALGQYKLELVHPRATRNSSNNEISFEVVLRDGTLPDFLVPSDIFLRSTKLTWSIGIQITVNYREQDENGKFIFNPYSGHVVSLSNSSNDWPHSPWDALEVEWDETNIEPTGRIGLWEAKPILHPNSDYNKNFDNYSISCLNKQEEQRISNAIDELLNTDPYQDLFHPFEYPVDPDLFPNYNKIIPVPICLDLIRHRLKNNYYRQIESLKFDIDKIYENCAKFNDDTSDIVTTAISLQSILHKIIDNNKNILENHNSTLNLRTNHNSNENEDLTTNKRRRIQTTEDSLLVMTNNKHNDKHERKQENHNNNTTSDSKTLKRKQSSSNQYITEVVNNKTNKNTNESSRSSRRNNNSNNTTTTTTNTTATNNNNTSSTRSRNQINYNEEEDEEEEEEEEEDDDDRDNSSNNSDDSEENSNNNSSEVSSSMKNKKRLTNNNHSNKTNKKVSLNNNSQLHRRSNRKAKSKLNNYKFASSDDDDDEEDDNYNNYNNEIISTRNKRNQVASNTSKTISSKYKDRQQTTNSNNTSNYNNTSNNNNNNKPILVLEETRSKRIDPEIKRTMLDILKFAEELDQINNYFSYPVSEDDAPGYFDIISTPMDLSTIRSNILNRKYERIQVLTQDILLIYDNCLLYNDDTSTIAREALKQKKSFKSYITTNTFSK